MGYPLDLLCGRPGLDCASDDNDDLSLGAALRQFLYRVGCAVQRIPAGDVWPNFAFLVQPEQVRKVGGMPLGIARNESAPEHADDLAGFQKCKIQRQLGNARWEADHE